MGQRLVITIEKNEEAIAAIYYHWSAYTYSALQETKKVIDCIYNHRDETQDEMLLRLIKCIEENGGGIRATTEEFDYIKSLYPNEKFKTENYDRCNGLIALSKQGIADLQNWSEGDVFIDLDTDQVDFCVYSGYESIEEYIEEIIMGEFIEKEYVQAKLHFIEDMICRSERQDSDWSREIGRASCRERV